MNADDKTPMPPGAELARGLDHHRAGRLDDAEAAYRAILAAEPENTDALHYLGVVRLQRGQAGDALDLIERALQLNPGDADALNNLGQALEALGRMDDALHAYRAAVDRAPGFAGALVNLGTRLAARGDSEAALDALSQADAAAPGEPEILVDLGNVLGTLGRIDEARAHIERALVLDPDFAQAHYNLGVVCRAEGRIEDAARAYGKAVALDPANRQAVINLGGALVDLGRLDDAEALYRRALERDAEDAEAHYMLALVLLRRRRFADGWAEYDWRWKVKNDARMRALKAPPWRGEDLGGKTIVVWAEQGVGDEVMFASMVPDLIAAGADVVLECDPRLVALFERSFRGVRCMAKADPPDAIAGLAGVDFQTAAGNLARWLRPDADSFPAPARYLVPEPGLTGRLRAKYRALAPGNGNGSAGGPAVGVAWYSKNEQIGADKSMALAELRPLAEIPGLALIDLQYGERSDERAQFAAATGQGLYLDDDVDQMADLDAFAAQVAALDLVVSISNTTVHMAGALGVPALVMLNAVPLACWGVEGAESHWYPSLRLYRQDARGAWTGVIGRVAAAVGEFAAGPGRNGT